MYTAIIATLLNNATKPVVSQGPLDLVEMDRVWAFKEGLDHVVVVVDNFCAEISVVYSDNLISADRKRALWAACAEVVAAALR